MHNGYLCKFKKMQVETLKSGQEIMDEFYSSVVPRVRDPKMFGGAGLGVGLRLVCFNRYAMVVIYHSVQKRSVDGIYQTIRRLTDEEVLARNNPKDSLHQFNITALLENNDYFCASAIDFKDFKSLVYVPLLV